MSDAHHRLPTSTGHPVWEKLSRYRIGPGDAYLSFAQRLARDNGWDLPHAERVIDEYRRFAFLAVVVDHPVTPSDAVDQAWHLHLIYTRDYWERFCPDVLGRTLHHGPTAGGAAEHRRYYEQYAATLRSYERVFGVTPPNDLWPSARKRLFEDPRARRVHPRDGIVIPWTVLSASALATALASIAVAVAYLHWW